MIFAVSHALHRLSAPRHSPHALSRLPTVLQQSIPLACIRFFILSISKSLPEYSPLSGSEYHGYKIIDSAYRVNHGADRNRTDGLRLAKAALSQLSYSPAISGGLDYSLVGLGRLELPTSPLSGVRSNHLSYRPSRFAKAIFQS